MITYRNLILADIAMTFNVVIGYMPINFTDRNIDRSEHRFFGVNLIPENDIIDFVFDNDGTISIDYIHDGTIDKATDSISADNITISTKIYGLTPEKELEYYLKFGQKEDVYFS